MSRPVYLDYAATTPVDPRVAAAMAECLTVEGEFANPASASHDYGDAAGARVESARRQVAQSVGASPDEVIWTSGATEANNLAIFGVAAYYREQGRHVITARTEHKAVLDPCRELERRGCRVTYLAPDRGGVIDPGQVAAALQSDTVLVSIMHVNNEIGVIQDIAALGDLCASHGSAKLHVDAAQSIGKCALDFAALGVDLMSLSAHKAYGPKGVGALLVSQGSQRVAGVGGGASGVGGGASGVGGGAGGAARGERAGKARVQLSALQFGGGQERGLRAGTVATHQVVGMGLAVELASTARVAESARLGVLRERLWQSLEALGGVWRNGAADRSVAQILNVSFEGVEGESLVAAVRAELAVSTGSACTSASQEPSYVLRALGRDERLSESSLRFGLGRFTSESDIDTAVAVVTREVRRLRRVSGA
jgi:cysteine desulfurase